jgi:hypothetical protein
MILGTLPVIASVNRCMYVAGECMLLGSSHIGQRFCCVRDSSVLVISQDHLGIQLAS